MGGKAVGTQAYSSTALSSGSHTFYVKMRDADNGNLSTTYDSTTWVITPADPSITLHPAPPANDAYGNSYSFTFNDTDATAVFRCSVDGGTYNTCSSPFSFPNTASGASPFRVKAYDQMNTYPSNGIDCQSWVITPPNPSITSTAPPANDAYGNSYSFTFNDTDATAVFRCSVDGGTWTTRARRRSASRIPLRVRLVQGQGV